MRTENEIKERLKEVDAEVNRLWNWWQTADSSEECNVARDYYNQAKAEQTTLNWILNKQP